ncbi:NUDIX hydrolase [Hahella sp. CR1]|uniref:NUDIX hydrolase n=1 Tax=Hahella sp. CR1 TaxID=2992807 RepID=UPI0024410D03|nr:NUDIX domain-containing protein [Hahella sp. CR1]MDG9666546.1 NUDIX hydrolase [Hahella sp. CR1]
MQDHASEKDFLAAYNIHDYEVPLTSVDMAIFKLREQQLEVLLVKRSQHPAKDTWALPGGFIDLKKDNVLEDTAHRKLVEKTGVKSPYLEQVATFGGKQRDPRGWSVTVVYFALVAHEEIGVDPKGAKEETRWVSVTEALSDYKLAFDHNEILRLCRERLTSKVQYTALPIHLLPEEFTLTELQKVFEVILGNEVEKKSFRRRILDADILEESGAMRTGSNRPAKLYRLKRGVENHFFPRTIEGPRS